MSEVNQQSYDSSSIKVLKRAGCGTSAEDVYW